MILLKNIRYFDGEQIVDDSAVLVDHGKIAGIFHGAQLDAASGCGRIIDGHNQLLVPGYIDIHIHGCSGCDVMDATEESLQKIAVTLAKNGTTSFLPTTVTMSKEATGKAIRNIRSCMGHSHGADILGIHLEGPFVNPERKGAQNPDYILSPSVDRFLDFVDHDLQDINRVTLAPEIGDGMELTEYLLRQGICVSAGHTCADYQTIEKCADAGMALCTHLFNGMDPLHHRNPGTVGAVLTDDRISAEFIPDLIHIDKAVLKLIVKAKGTDKCILITDSLSAACMGDGVYDLGGQKVLVTGHCAKLESGSLAGSVITLKDAVKNMVREIGLDLCSVLKMAASNPAKILGIGDRKGCVKVGYDADLNLLNQDLAPVMMMVRGEIVQ